MIAISVTIAIFGGTFAGKKRTLCFSISPFLFAKEVFACKIFCFVQGRKNETRFLDAMLRHESIHLPISQKKDWERKKKMKEREE